MIWALLYMTRHAKFNGDQTWRTYPTIGVDPGVDMVPFIFKQQGPASSYPTHSGGLTQPSWWLERVYLLYHNQHLSPPPGILIPGHGSGNGFCRLAASHLVDPYITLLELVIGGRKLKGRSSTGDWIGFFEMSSLGWLVRLDQDAIQPW